MKNTLFSTPKERHAFVTGIGDALCFWRQEMWHAELKGENHYFALGRGLGALTYIAPIFVLIYHLLW